MHRVTSRAKLRILLWAPIPLGAITLLSYALVGRSDDEIISLRASCGAVYCYRSCLFVGVCGWVGLLPR